MWLAIQQHVKRLQRRRARGKAEEDAAEGGGAGCRGGKGGDGVSSLRVAGRYSFVPATVRAEVVNMA